MTTNSRPSQVISNSTTPAPISAQVRNAQLESNNALPVPVPPIRREPMGRPVAIRRTRLLRFEWWVKMIRRQSKPVLVNEDWLSNPKAIQSNHEGAVS